MTGLFLTVVKTARIASFVILAILPIRFLLKKSPRQITCLLWGILALRLLVPYSIESNFSILPPQDRYFAQRSENAEALSFLFESPFSAQTETELSSHATENEKLNEPKDPSDQMKKAESITVFAFFWAIGTSFFILYTVGSFLILKRKMRDSIPFEKNIRMSEKVTSPFVLGVFTPKIYIPFHLDPLTQNAVLSHEKAHIKRLDHLIKPFSFFLLSVYWFHPLIWLSYFLLCRDIEVACDETVISKMKEQERCDYAKALLRFGTNKHKISACPLAFGEENIKERILRTMKYKKPLLCTFVLASVLVLVASVCLLTDPKSDSEPKTELGENLVTIENNHSITPVQISANYIPAPCLYTSISDADIYWDFACNKKEDEALPLMVINNREDLENFIGLSHITDNQWISEENNKVISETYTDDFFKESSLLVFYSNKNKDISIIGGSIAHQKSGEKIVFYYQDDQIDSVSSAENCALPLLCYSFQKNQATRYYDVTVKKHSLKESAISVNMPS